MEPQTLAEVITVLRGPTLRSRVALWLHPPEVIGREGYLALQLDLDAVDLRDELERSLPEYSPFVVVTLDRLLSLLDEVAQRPDRGCALVYNFDLLLSAMPREECLVFWESITDSLPYRRRGLLLAVPRSAHHLLPLSNSLEAWRQASRLVGALQFPTEISHGPAQLHN